MGHGRSAHHRLHGNGEGDPLHMAVAQGLAQRQATGQQSVPAAGGRFGASADFFNQDPVVIDLSPVHADAKAIPFAHLIALLREHRMVPVAVKGGSAAQMAAAQAVGLFEAPDGPSAKVPVRVETVVQHNIEAGLEEALRYETAGLAYARKAPDDVKESRASFLEKRPGVYTGT